MSNKNDSNIKFQLTLNVSFICAEIDFLLRSLAPILKCIAYVLQFFPSYVATLKSVNGEKKDTFISDCAVCSMISSKSHYSAIKGKFCYQ